MPIAINRHLGHDDPQACPDAFYIRQGSDQFVSTLHSQGAWQPGEQHLAVAAGLVLAEAERRLPSDKLVSRVSFDVLGVIHSGPFTIDVHLLRPGRSIELIEACMRHGDQTCISARIWRLGASDTASVQGQEWPSMPPPESMPIANLADTWEGGFIQALQGHRSADARPGRAQTWLRTAYPLVAGEVDPPTAAFAKLIDTANGLAVRQDPRQVFFANVDLSIHFTRQPVPDWVGFDTRVSFGPTGLGETFSVLSDIHGPVGTAAQSLTVRLR